MQKYLFITEKSSLVKTFEKVYLENKDLLGYEADFTYAIAPVSHIKEKIRKVNLEEGCWNKLELKNVNLPDGYYIYNSNIPTQLDGIKKLIDDNNYDLIINACDADIYGQLEYEFIKNYIEFSVPDKRMVCKDLTDEAILKFFQNLEDNKEYLNKLLSEL